MKITNEILEMGRSSRGGWSGKQLRVLGVKTTYKNPGWKMKLVGADVPLDNVKEFIALKDSHLKAKDLQAAQTLLFADLPDDMSHRMAIRTEIEDSRDNGN